MSVMPRNILARQPLLMFAVLASCSLFVVPEIDGEVRRDYKPKRNQHKSDHELTMIPPWSMSKRTETEARPESFNLELAFMCPSMM